jgi:hypothetical protein
MLSFFKVHAHKLATNLRFDSNGVCGNDSAQPLQVYIKIGLSCHYSCYGLGTLIIERIFACAKLHYILSDEYYAHNDDDAGYNKYYPVTADKMKESLNPGQTGSSVRFKL